MGNGSRQHILIYGAICIWWVFKNLKFYDISIDNGTLAALFYGGYGATMIPSFGIIDAYGGFTPEYYNALGFFILCEYLLSSPLGGV